MNIRSIFGIPRWIWNHKKRVIIITLCVLPVLLVVFFALQPKKAEIITAEATRGDLRQIVEAVGSVISEGDLNLEFSRGGVVSRVLVNEGDIVQAGAVLAQSNAGSLGATIGVYRARLDAEQAALDQLLEGSRPQDIDIAKAQLEQKRSNLEVARRSLVTAEQSLQRSSAKLELLKNEATINVAGDISTARSIGSREKTKLLSELSALLAQLDTNDIEDVYRDQAYSTYYVILGDLRDAQSAVQRTLGSTIASEDYRDTLEELRSLRLAGSNASDAARTFYSSVLELHESGNFTFGDKEELKAAITTAQTNIDTSIAAIESEVSKLSNATANYDTLIATEEQALTRAEGEKDRAEADIASFEAGVIIAEAELSKMIQGPRETEIKAAQARVRQAQSDVSRVAADYNETIIKAPIDGIITKVNVKAGEYAPTGPAVTMLGQTPYRVEIFVPEVDIPKVALNQTGSVELEAFPEVLYALTVSEIDPGASDIDGVPKYRVVLDFVYPHDEFKIDMTGDVEIVSDFRNNVVSVPSRAIVTRDDKKYVRIQESDELLLEREVETGMEGEGGSIEIVNGLEGGETVVVLYRE